MRPAASFWAESLRSSSSSRAREAGSNWRRLAAMTTSSSQRRSPCCRRILRPLELRNYSARLCRRDKQAGSFLTLSSTERERTEKQRERDAYKGPPPGGLVQ